jgi:hypothetical protein
MGAAIAILAVMGIVANQDASDASMRIEPRIANVQIGTLFEARIVVDATTPVNVFAGDVSFDPSVLAVDSIEYNTSIADLWAVRPWYDNGAGTLNFGGGTTAPGGFTGTGTLITMRFKAIGPGNGAITVQNARILKHDGLGTDVPQSATIDSIITVLDTPPVSDTATRFLVTDVPPSPDINGDGVVTFADASIMILNLASDDPRFDLDRNGAVDRADLAIVLNAR